MSYTTAELLGAIEEIDANIGYAITDEKMRIHYEGCLDEIAEIVKRDVKLAEWASKCEETNERLACENEKYRAIGTPEQFAELMKAKVDGRIAECTCGECKRRETSKCAMHYEAVLYDGTKFDRYAKPMYQDDHFCGIAERRDKDDF